MDMIRTIPVALLLLLGSAANASVISGGTYLDAAGANQLESWLGVGDQDFTNIWSGVTGASASSWHAAVNGKGPTFSIYEMTIHDGTTAYVGGYTAADWDFIPGIDNNTVFDPSAFIFNLTTGEVQRQVDGDSFEYGVDSILHDQEYFATFGGGHDLSGGYENLGVGDSSKDGHTNSHTYELSKGQISVAGDSGYGSGDSGYHYKLPVVTGLQTYTFAAASPPISPVPLPPTVFLFSAGLIGLLGATRKTKNQ